MSYQLPADVEQFVKQRIASGAYSSEDDVLRDALSALEQREEQLLARWHDRNQLAIEQSKQGFSRTLAEQRVLARLR